MDHVRLVALDCIETLVSMADGKIAYTFNLTPECVKSFYVDDYDELYDAVNRVWSVLFDILNSRSEEFCRCDRYMRRFLEFVVDNKAKREVLDRKWAYEE